jgi:hypothetical protein
MKIAVITPYLNESEEQLLRCYESVKSQQFDCDQFFVSDGSPKSFLDEIEGVKHVKLPVSSRDFGNTPRAIAGMLISNSDIYDAACYLDADNFFLPGHLELVTRNLKNFDIVCSKREFFCPAGRHLMGAYDPDEDANQHVDTNCIFISNHKGAFRELSFWGRIPREVSYSGDRIFFQYLVRERYSFKFLSERTVGYESRWRNHYVRAGVEPPGDARTGTMQPRKWIYEISGARKTVNAIGFLPIV